VAAVPVDRRSDCGIVSLNAMAVLRLITSWNCAICSSSGQHVVIPLADNDRLDHALKDEWVLP
jgi:hypothetical protein